jgi:uncharacterized membrane-anchored protein YjiN (DUF445 family)
MECRVGRVLEEVAGGVRREEAARSRWNGWLREGVAQLAERHRGDFGALIEETVRGWEATTLVAKLEREVGPDLQFIRINGTLIGGALGLALHALGKLFP